MTFLHAYFRFPLLFSSQTSMFVSQFRRPTLLVLTEEASPSLAWSVACACNDGQPIFGGGPKKLVGKGREGTTP